MNKEFSKTSAVNRGECARRPLVLLGLAWAMVASGLAAPIPDAARPTSMRSFLPGSWDLATVTRRLWVEPGAQGDGTSLTRATGSIQQAVDGATPGTVILVGPGHYVENVRIARQDGVVSGTDESPILLISAGGPDAAVIESVTDACTVEGYGIANWAVVGFRLIGAGSTTAGDHSPIKIGAGNIATGDASRNWLVAGNTFAGQGRDGSKAYNTRNVVWLGNTYEGNWGEEACDNVIVGVTDPQGAGNGFWFNTVGGSSGYSAITLKYGTNHYAIACNDFTLETGTALPRRGATIRVGGNGNLQRFIERVPVAAEAAFSPPTASHVRVWFNRFASECGINVELYGCRDSEVVGNDLVNPRSTEQLVARTAKLGHDAEGRPYVWGPLRNRIIGNRIAATELNAFAGGLSSGQEFVVEDNSAAVEFAVPVGAGVVRPLIEDFITGLAASHLPMSANR